MRLPCSRRSYCGKPSSRLTGWPRLNSGFLQVPTQGRSLSHVATSEHVGNQTAPSSDSAHADVMVIGSMSVDLTCTVPTTSWSSMHMYGSHITKISSSAGGVAHNVALATSYASSSSVRLVTAVGSDPEGQWLREYVKTVGLDVDFIRAEGETARYIAVQDGQGQTVVNFADMSVIEGFNHEDLRMKIRNTTPKFLAFDGYVSPSSVKTILEECGPQTKVLFEPASVPRAATIFQKPVELGVFPNHLIDIITANVFELKAIFRAAQKNHHFEGAEWWSVVDSLDPRHHFCQDVEFLLRKVSRLHRHGSLDDPIELEYNVAGQVPQDGLELKLGRDVTGEGALQQVVALLPYIPNIFLKLGSLGVLSVRLCPKDTEVKKTNVTLRFAGHHTDVVVQHHPGLPHKGIVNVTGAGDTFAGVLLAKLAGGSTIDEAVDMAQKAAVMTLASPHAVSKQIRKLKL